MPDNVQFRFLVGKAGSIGIHRFNANYFVLNLQFDFRI